MTVDPRTPVLVGVGVASQELDPRGSGAEACELMASAVAAAAVDSGRPGLLRAVQLVAVPRGTWSYTDPARLVAARIGAPGATTVLAEIGIPQQTPVSDAMSRIARGELDVAVVVGGEAKRRAAEAGRAGIQAVDTAQSGPPPDVHLRPEGEMVARPEINAGIWVPVQQYALIDNALRRAEGATIAEHRDDIARLWAGLNTVAQRNPRAAFPAPRHAGFLREPGPDNRPLAFPYAKWHSTQWTVDQAGAMLLCSAETARAHGVPLSRWVFPRVALESSHMLSLSRRRDMHRWPAMAVLGSVAARKLGRALADVAHVELYSCFPSAVRVQQRELGLPPDGIPSVTGGMAFAGGPFNNFTYQATATIVGRLRAAPGELGLVSTVSGLLTKAGLMVWSSDPGEGTPLVADLAADVAAATGSVEVAEDYRGPARIASYTVTYESFTPARVIAIADEPEGRRCVAISDDPALAERGTSEELIGLDIAVSGGSFTA